MQTLKGNTFIIFMLTTLKEINYNQSLKPPGRTESIYFSRLVFLFPLCTYISFYRCITNDHKLSGLKQHKIYYLIISMGHKSGRVQALWFLCSVSRQSEMKIQPSPDVIWDSKSSSKLTSCQNSVIWKCSTDIPISLVVVIQGLLDR